MANRIKIRHGNSQPSVEDLSAAEPVVGLLPYELGWDGTNLVLYINNNNTGVVPAALSMKGGVLSGNLWVGTTNDTGERQVGVASAAGNLYMFAHGTANGSRGLYTTNSGGTSTSQSIIIVNANGVAAFYGGIGDRTNNTITYLNYGAAGLTASDITWLTCWNGYELRAISKAEMANAVDSSHKWVRIGGDTMTGALVVKYTTENTGTVTGITFWRPVSGSSNAGAYITARNDKLSASIGVGSGGSNHGLYSVGYSADGTTVTSSGQWIIYRNGTGQTVIPDTLILTKTQDASGTANNFPALIVGGAATAAHLEMDGNEILAKSNATTPTTLYLQDGTGTVSVSGSGGLKVTNGNIVSQSTSCSWLTGQNGTYAPYNVGDATNSDGYWPWLRQTNTNSGKWFSFGTLGNRFYMMGSATTRTTNGYDHGLYFDVSDGKLVVENCAVIRDSGTTARKIFLTTSATKPSAAVAGDIVLVKV